MTSVISPTKPTPMICYRDILKSELAVRRGQNARYSLRGFARDLSISQPFLSQVLNRKKKLSDEMGAIVAGKLKLTGTRRRIFVDLVRLEHLSEETSRKILQAEIERLLNSRTQFKIISEDVFNVISDWHYFAIIELTALIGFKNQSTWIAKRLRIEVHQAEIAVATLKRVGLLQEVDGKLFKVERDYIFANIPSAAIRKHHRGTLALAETALRTQPLETREFFTVCFPMDPALIAIAKNRIREFSEDLMGELQQSKPKSVYKLAVQFFRLDKDDT